MRRWEVGRAATSRRRSCRALPARGDRPGDRIAAHEVPYSLGDDRPVHGLGEEVDSHSLASRWLQRLESTADYLGAYQRVTVGYRFGDLRDPDFSVRGGHGAFLTLGTRVTEESVTTVADFWRSRFGN